MSPTPSNRSGSSGSSTYTGGQSTGAMLDHWASSQNPTEAFYATGAKSGRGAMKGADNVVAFEKKFKKASS